MPKRSRLLTTIFRPDVWFVMPPICNVVFPEECASVSYTRQMMRETTRLQLQTFSGLLSGSSSGAAEELIQRYYFAPSLLEQNIEGQLVPSLPSVLEKQSSSALSSTFYSHEKFTGVVPKIERIADTAFYAAGELAAGNTGFNRNASAVSTVDQYAERVALFNLLRNRYMARQASVNGRFMPRLVAGFPALIVNRPPSTATEDPIHFVGMITSLSHTLSQEGGNTSVSLSYARPHTVAAEEDGFLRLLTALQAEGTTERRDVSASYDGTRTSAAAKELSDFSQKIATASELLAQNGKNHQEIYNLLVARKIAEANELYMSVINGEVLPDFQGLRQNSFNCRAIFYNRPLDNDKTWGPATIDEFWDEFQKLNNADREAMLALYQVEGVLAAAQTGKTVADVDQADFQAYEDARQNTTGAVYIGGEDFTITPQFLFVEFNTEPILFKRSFEQIVTPAWFSDAYSNEKISDYYSSLLGCVSLGDKVGARGRSQQQVDNSQVSSEFSVENAAKKLVGLYAKQENVKTNDGDPAFVYNTTKREIASQDDVLKKFHRFAFADSSADALYGLDSSGGGVQELNKNFIAATKNNTGAALDLSFGKLIDPRQDRRSAVQSYVAQLTARAFRG